MSAEAMAWAAKQKTGKKTRAKLVLMALAHYADASGCCFVASQRTLADFTGQCERTVRDSLRYLEKADLIEREPRFREDGSQTSDSFRLKIKRPASELCAAHQSAIRRLCDEIGY